MLDQTIDNAIIEKPTQREYLLQALQQLEMQAAELGVTYLLKTYVDIYRLLYLSESTTVNSSLQGYT